MKCEEFCRVVELVKYVRTTNVCESHVCGCLCVGARECVWKVCWGVRVMGGYTVGVLINVLKKQTYIP
jgi:hypothetical protein